jgi:hypothetical protein
VSESDRLPVKIIGAVPCNDTGFGGSAIILVGPERDGAQGGGGGAAVGVTHWGSSDRPWLASLRTCSWMRQSTEGWQGSGWNGVGSGMWATLLTPSMRISVTSLGSGVVSGSGKCTGSSLMLEGCLGL